VRKTKRRLEERELVIGESVISSQKFHECVRLAIRDTLSDASMSPQKVANLTGVDAANLRRVVAGKRTIGLFNLFRVAIACDIRPEDIVQRISDHLREEITGRHGK